MKGADEYAKIFQSNEQIGRLVLIPGRHARGDTFRIFVLPAGDEAIFNGPHNAPLNKDAVEVFGVVSGNRGWTETYGWKFTGPWQHDFEDLFQSRKNNFERDKLEQDQQVAEEEAENTKRVFSLLSSYR